MFILLNPLEVFLEFECSPEQRTCIFLSLITLIDEDVDHLADKTRLPSYLVVGIEKFWNEYTMTNY